VQNSSRCFTAVSISKPPSAAGRHDGEGKGGPRGCCAVDDVTTDRVDDIAPKPCSSLLQARLIAVANDLRTGLCTLDMGV